MKVTLLALWCLTIQFGMAFLIGRFIRTGHSHRCTGADAQPGESLGQAPPLGSRLPAGELDLTQSLVALCDRLNSRPASPTSGTEPVVPRQAPTA